MSWGVAQSPECVLCNTRLESLAHHFSECRFSSQVWDVLVRKNGGQQVSRRIEDLKS